jgi:hypothetical protein
MPGRASWVPTLVLLGLLSSPAIAQEAATVKTADPGAVEDTEAPSMELLEFLGAWETADGEWIDPEEMEQIELQEPEHTNDETPQP